MVRVLVFTGIVAAAVFFNRRYATRQPKWSLRLYAAAWTLLGLVLLALVSFGMVSQGAPTVTGTPPISPVENAILTYSILAVPVIGFIGVVFSRSETLRRGQPWAWPVFIVVLVSFAVSGTAAWALLSGTQTYYSAAVQPLVNAAFQTAPSDPDVQRAISIQASIASGLMITAVGLVIAAPLIAWRVQARKVRRNADKTAAAAELADAQP